MSTERKGFVFKIALLGDEALIISLMANYSEGSFRERDYMKTLGAQFSKYAAEIDDFSIKLFFWGICSHPDFDFMRPTFYKGSKASIVIFSRARQLRYEDALVWVEDIQDYVENIPIVILEDISEKKDSETLNDYNKDPRYYQVNLKSGEGIIKAFNFLTNKLYKRYKDTPRKIKEREFRVKKILKPIPRNFIKKEYEINEYITMKLVNNRTEVYVKGRLFNQCMYLLLNLNLSRFQEYDGIQSIDEAAERLNQGFKRTRIDPETEFWGHCSNMEVWIENNYDTRLLHRNIAFPLLKRLTDVGDPIARRYFKEEIAKRYSSGYPSVVKYLEEQGYLNYLSEEELSLLKNN